MGGETGLEVSAAMDVRIRFAALLLQNLEHAGDRLANVVFQFVERITLRIAPGEGGDLSPITTLWLLVDDNGVFPQKPILSHGPL